MTHEAVLSFLMVLMFGLFLLLIALLITWAIMLIFVPYWVHKDMVKAEKIPWKYISFTEFKHLYNEHFFCPSKDFPGSCFLYTDFKMDGWYEQHRQNYLHADIIIFDGVGRIFYPWSYYLFAYWKYSLKKRVTLLKKKEVPFVVW